MSDNRAVFKMIFSPNNTGQLHADLTQMIEGVFRQVESEKTGSKLDDKRLAYISRYRAQGCLAVISMWVEGGFAEPKEFIVETITELCATRLPQRMKIPSADIQVLSPTRKGELGTVNLNKHLQEALNPPAKEKKEKLFGNAVFREGDRVMQIRNNYDIMWRNEANTAAGNGIYNGDIGVIRQIDPEQETMTVDFDGRIAVYTFDLLLELEHAWAMTVHKSQGSEYRAVILALCAASQMLMSRDILYTAVTRAKELLILVGDDQIAYQMIDNVRQSRRYNALRLRIRKLSGLQG